ncbi:glycosyl hydrolases family 28 domain-containing protein [Rhizoctonia solani AG-1 IA]|uniref:galacturonan 1,4-alpha-galacturonidase n=1 Tax=Thanatephorus cucumeris (strain AG1-IA) TaxID=983506 RepID=L8WWY0_THACA|nr:glycosyl hydrolases family 28 domain-containing protein [Rhizoctonia solani AG-1 IA]
MPSSWAPTVCPSVAFLNIQGCTILLRTSTFRMLHLGTALTVQNLKMAYVSRVSQAVMVMTCLVNNITYQDIVVKDVTHPVVIDSCYMEDASHPAQTNITDVHINNVTGTSSGSTVVSLSCTPKAACYVYMKDINIKPPKGSAKYVCTNLSDPSDVGIPCTSK